MEAQGSHGPTGLLLINLGTPNGPRAPFDPTVFKS